MFFLMQEEQKFEYGLLGLLWVFASLWTFEGTSLTAPLSGFLQEAHLLNDGLLFSYLVTSNPLGVRVFTLLKLLDLKAGLGMS